MMGWYSVVEPCVVGKLHYATIPVQPIKVDDEVAAPLVEAGSLVSYPPVEVSDEVSEPDLGESVESNSQEAKPARGRRRPES